MLSQIEIEALLQQPNANRAATVEDLQMLQNAIREIYFLTIAKK